jgi:hypothetical protein
VIDLSNLKAPGWSKVVAELSGAAPDDRSYLERLLAVISQVSAARQGVLYGADRREGDEVEPRPLSVWPPAAATGEAAPPLGEQIEQATEARDAARGALSSGQARAYGLDKASQYYDPGPGQGYVLAVPLGAGPDGRPTAAITLLLEPRSREAVRSTLAMAEVLAGYVHAHAARQALRRTQQASFAFDLATRLIASVNTAPSFRGAAMQLVNDLAKQFAADRVALGWVRGGRGASADSLRVEAISDTEHFDRRMAMVQGLKEAMEECFDQEQPVLYPPPPSSGREGDVLLSQAIVHAHRKLASGDARLKVCSLPLRIDEEVVGVVTLESGSEGPLDVATIELIQSAMDLVAPVMRIRRSDDRNLALRAWDSAVRAAAWAVGPRHTVWKATGVLLLAAAVAVTVVRITYRVGADAVLEPRVRRIVSSPQDGVIRAIGVDVQGRPIEPGSEVREGDLLVELDDTPWRLGLIEAQKKRQQALLQAAAAAKEGEAGQAKVKQFEAQAEQAAAEMAVYQYRLERSQIRAPITGTVLGGRLVDRIGASVKLGDALMEVAPLRDMIVVARVDERDIALVTRAMAEGRGRGILGTRSRPSEAFGFEVERIVPLAESKEGRNEFEVRARLERVEPWMRPGMEARARFDTERRSLLWIGTRRIIEAVRLWFW